MGLVQRKIEAAGLSTITLSSIPDLTSAVRVPRLAAIESPLGYLFGQPGDWQGQTAVLRTTLQALAEADRPGYFTRLPFDWPTSAWRLSAHPPKMPPISSYLLRHPWYLPNLLSREVPVSQEVATTPKPKAAIV